jgi:hypothetical protein
VERLTFLVVDWSGTIPLYLHPVALLRETLELVRHRLAIGGTNDVPVFGYLKEGWLVADLAIKSGLLPAFDDRCSRGKHALSQEVEAGPAVALALQQLELVDEALGRAVRPRLC